MGSQLRVAPRWQPVAGSPALAKEPLKGRGASARQKRRKPVYRRASERGLRESKPKQRRDTLSS